MDITKIRAYLTAIDTGSLTRAADRLDYTTSGLSHMMSALEQETGIPLLIRSPRGVMPAPAADELIPVMRELLNTNERLEQLVSQLNGLQTGRIVIGSYTSIAEQWLAPVIKKFAADYPDIDIEICEGTHQELDVLLAEKRIDLCFYSYKRDYQGDWISLASDPLLAILPPSHPAAHDPVYQLHNCQKEDMIMSSGGADCDVLDLLRSLGLRPHIRYSTYEDCAALSLIECGLGIGIMNELITKGRSARVVRLPLEPSYSIELGIAVPSLQKAAPAAQRFISYAKKMLIR